MCHYLCSVADHTNELWEMEQRQKQERHQLLKQELREAFHMQRHQMHSRHQKVHYTLIHLFCHMVCEQCMCVFGTWFSLCGHNLGMVNHS